MARFGWYLNPLSPKKAKLPPVLVLTCTYRLQFVTFSRNQLNPTINRVAAALRAANYEVSIHEHLRSKKWGEVD